MKQAFLTLLFVVGSLFASAVVADPVQISTDPFAVQPLLSGSKSPTFVAKDATGKSFAFDAEKRDRPAVLIFYRGGWCPYCNVHLQELRKVEDQLIAAGADLFFLSPDSPAKLTEAIEASDEQNNYTLLSDASMEISKAFGIAFKLDDETIDRYKNYGIDLEQSSGYDHHLLPAPAVFIVDTDGLIKFQYVNPDYKVRLSPEVLLAAAKTMPTYQLPR